MTTDRGGLLAPPDSGAPAAGSRRAAAQQPAADADQRVAADAAAVQHGGVARDHALFDFLRTVGVRVDDATILQVDARTEGDPRQVAADDGAEPDVDAGGEDDVT